MVYKESVALKTKYMNSNVKPLSKRFGFAKVLDKIEEFGLQIIMIIPVCVDWCAF